MKLYRCIISIVLALLITACNKEEQAYSQPQNVYINKSLSSPADIVMFKNKYVVSEIYNNRLAILDSYDDHSPEYFEPETIGKRFRSPHHLAVTPRDTLLISNGWGNSIVEIEDLEGAGWTEFTGIGKSFNAPHGVCVNDEGQIYVGDSLNSRVVRFDDMQGGGWKEFMDEDKKIAYSRQLVCDKNGLWISNSYVNRKGLNPGQGANVLLIRDFTADKAETVFHHKNTNFTGLLPKNNQLIISFWGAYNRIGVIVKNNPEKSLFWDFDRQLGTPYSIQQFENQQETFQYGVAFIGFLKPQNSDQTGGIVFFNIE